MNIINRLTIQNLKLNKKRTIVTIIGIILSGAMICGVASLVASFQDLFVQSAIATEGNFHVTFKDVPHSDSQYITENANTKSSLISRTIGYAKFDGESFGRPYLLIKAYNSEAFSNLPIHVKEGRLPEKANEIALSEQLVSRNSSFKIGDTIALPIGERKDKGELLSSNMPLSETETFSEVQTITYTITGSIEKPRYEPYNTPSYSAVTFLDESTLQPGDLLNVSILLKKPRSIYKIVPQMAESVGISDYTYNNELLKWMGISKNANYNNMIMSVGLVIISLVVVGSVTVIYNAFSISVSERKKQFGMLSSVGATAKQIRKTIYFEGFVLGLIGIPLGILSGVLGIGATIKVINPLMQGSMINTDVSLRLVVSPMVPAATVFFVSLVILLSAYIPAIKASRISPIEAIRLNTDIKIKAKKVKTSKLTRLLFGFEGELALKNLKRNRRRYRATVFSLFISIVLFVSFSTFINYGFQSTEMYYQDLDYNLSITKYDASHEELLDITKNIAGLDDLDNYTAIRTINASVAEEYKSKFKPYFDVHYKDSHLTLHDIYIPVDISTMNTKAFEKYIKEIGLNVSDFTSEGAPKAILINKNLSNAEKYTEYKPSDIEKGEVLQIRINPLEEGIEPINIELQTAAVTEVIPFGFSQGNSITLIVHEDDFENLYTMLDADSKKNTDHMNMKVSTKKPDEVAKAIEELHDQKYSGRIYVYNVTAAVDETQKSKLVIAIFLYGFITLITLIGVTNIFNTISTNVALRRREFAMLKSVGMTPHSFNKMLNFESIFYGLKALLYGLPISILVSAAMYNSFSNAFEFQFMLPWKSIMICVAGVFAITFMTMIHSSNKLKNDNIVDTLKGENL